jgi:hypothetical protein
LRFQGLTILIELGFKLFKTCFVLSPGLLFKRNGIAVLENDYNGVAVFACETRDEGKPIFQHLQARRIDVHVLHIDAQTVSGII